MSIPTNAPSASSLQNQSVHDSLMAATSSAVDRLVLSVRHQQAVIQQLLEVQSRAVGISSASRGGWEFLHMRNPNY